jgi:hypothetical protein
VSDACIPLLLPVGRSLRELDLSGGRITSRGAAVIAAYMKQLEVLDLCGGHITGVRGDGGGGRWGVGGGALQVHSSMHGGRVQE